MKIFIGADHAGFKLKQALKKYLTTLGVRYEDLGNLKFDSGDDYPDFAKKLAQQVSQTKNARGILICDSGIGVCIVANKVKNIRAANVDTLKAAKKSREHNNANVLCLGQDYLKTVQAKKIVNVWLSTKFSSVARHRRRVNKINKL
ncbi:RpiB/LacA/LacB family sugar-phosphate isomerase [Patescibacteria group bacterium]|nr:RpiB/LacA/LacB family sugar-phosphate isomerase [Patescibacteria group bacterium]